MDPPLNGATVNARRPHGQSQGGFKPVFSGLNDREDETLLEVFVRNRLENPGNRKERRELLVGLTHPLRQGP